MFRNTLCRDGFDVLKSERRLDSVHGSNLYALYMGFFDHVNEVLGNLHNIRGRKSFIKIRLKK